MSEPKPFTKEWNELVAKLEAQLDKKLAEELKNKSKQSK